MESFLTRGSLLDGAAPWCRRWEAWSRAASRSATRAGCSTTFSRRNSTDREGEGARWWRAGGRAAKLAQNFLPKSPFWMLLLSWLLTPIGSIHDAGRLALASILMIKNIDKIQIVDAYLHFLASKYSITHVDMPYKSTQVACIIGLTIVSQ